MTFEETLQFLKEQTGKWVEVNVRLPTPERAEPTHLAGFSGRIERVTQSGARALPEAWYVWFAKQTSSPNHGEFRLDRELFEQAEVQANVVEEPEERSESGATWTLTIRQRGVITIIDVYV